LFNEKYFELRVKNLISAAHLTTGSLIAACTGSGHIGYCFDLATGLPALAGTVTLSTGTQSQISWISSTGVICWGPAAPTYVDLSAGTSTVLTTQSTFPTTTSGKQHVLACNASTKKGLGATSTAGRLLKIDATALPTTPSTASINPTGLGSKTFSACIVRDSTTWLLGTVTGEIYEVDFSGTVNKTITLPTTPNIGTTPVHQVTNLVYANDDLLVVTDQGWMFHYKYSTSTLLETLLIREGITSGGYTSYGGGAIMTEILNGQFLHGPSIFLSNSPGQMLANMLLGNANFQSMEIDSWLLRPDSAQTSIAAGLNSTAQCAWFAYGTSSGQGASVIRVLGIDGLVSSTAPAQAQDPSGTDVTARLTRINRYKMGLARVELDQSITAGANSLAASTNSNYTDIYTKGTVGSSEKFDFRDFQT
jgi:hypothetical protein